MTATIGAVLSGSTALSMALDGAFERFLVRRGVRRPLLAMGAAGLVIGWAVQYFDVDDDADSRQTEPAALRAGNHDEQPSQTGEAEHRDDDRPLDAPPRA